MGHGFKNYMLPSFQYLKPKSSARQSLPSAIENFEKGARKELTYYPHIAAWMIKELHMTRKQFAEEIGVGLPRLNSYLSGAAQPPQDVCNRIDLAWQRLHKSPDRFRYKSGMRSVLDGWATSVGLSVNDTKKLAEICNVSTSTISRWRLNGVKPAKEVLVNLDSVFEKLKKEKTNG